MPEQEGSGKERVLAVGRHRVERGAGIEGWLPILLVLEHGDRVRREITKWSVGKHPAHWGERRLFNTADGPSRRSSVTPRSGGAVLLGSATLDPPACEGVEEVVRGGGAGCFSGPGGGAGVPGS